jgi:hypothetical protein
MFVFIKKFFTDQYQKILKTFSYFIMTTADNENITK